MPSTRHTFAQLDVDTERSAVQGTSILDAAVNIHFERGYVTGARGNRLVAYALPEGDNTVVGWCADGDDLLYFLCNSLGRHRLVRFSPALTSCTTLLEGAYLSLVASEPVLGAVVLDGLLVFRDGLRQLRAVPMDATARAQAVAALSADPLALHLVHQPPHTAPAASRERNTDASDPRSLLNQVAGSAWQFAFQYEYPSGERTPLGPYSDVLPVAKQLSTADAPDERNFVRVAYPAGALAASPLVKAIRILVREQADPTWQVAGTFTGAQPFDFYGSTTGEAIPAADAAKLSEALPVEVGCMTVAKSRVFVGDCLDGYAATAKEAALTATVTSAAGDATSEQVTIWQTVTEFKNIYYEQDGTERYTRETRTRYFRQATGTYPAPDSTYFEVRPEAGLYVALPGNPTFTYTQAFEDFANDEAELAYREITETTATTGAGTTQFDSYTTLRQRSAYPVGVAFYDALGRTAGAEAVRNVLVPTLDYADPRPQRIAWSLTLTPPAWAISYSLLLGQNRTASFFLQFQADQLRQYRGDLTTGASAGAPDLRPIRENGTAFVKEVWVSLTALLNSGRGYEFEAGDYLRFPGLTGDKLDFPILSERAGYVAISAAALRLFVSDFGQPLNTETPVVELYRPAVALTAPVLYERGPRYAILHPGTASAALSVTSGTLAGDCTLELGVNGGPALEHMNPGKADFALWLDASRGRAIPVVPDGRQVRRSTLLRYSGVKVQGTQLFGLSIWDATAQDDLPQEQGAVVRVGVADQTQAEGSLLLAVQERGAESRYLGQTALQQADGQQTLALTNGVLGGGNALRGGYGLAPRHAASFLTYAGKAYWYCAERDELVRYAQNGATPLAFTYKNQEVLRQIGQFYKSSAVVGLYDPRRGEYWLSFQAPRSQGANLLGGGRGQLVSALRLPGRTLVFSEKRETWTGELRAVPEAGAHAGQTFVSFQRGGLWLHDATAPLGSFYGTYAAPRLTFTVAQAAGISKHWRTVGVESEALWLPTTLTVPRATGRDMVSQMNAPWLAYLEGVWRGAFRMDANSPGGLLNGRPLVGERLQVTLTAPQGQEGEHLVACNVGWQPRAGQAVGQ